MTTLFVTDGFDLFEISTEHKKTVREIKLELLKTIKNKEFIIKHQDTNLSDCTLIENIPIKEGECLEVFYEEVKKSNKCELKDCKGRLALGGKECSNCNKNYCGRHRIQEAHECEKIVELKKQKFLENKEKLFNAATKIKKL